MDVMKKVPVREQAPDVRNKNFDEVCLGYNAEEAQEEATRCLNCKNARCVQGCPVSINIPEFIHNVKEGNFEEAFCKGGHCLMKPVFSTSSSMWPCMSTGNTVRRPVRKRY